MFANSLNLSLSILYERIRRGNFAKYLFLGVWSSAKSYLFLQNFENAFLEKIWSVIMVFLSSGKLYVFWRNFWQDLLENCMLSSYDNFSSWKIVCVLAELRKLPLCSNTFCHSRKIYMCSCTICVSPGKVDVFL